MDERIRPSISLLTAMAALFCALIATAKASEPGWQALGGGGSVAILRHARAPGTGDPANFRLEDCATQRNLSDEGREQSRRIGEAFRARSVPISKVLSSRWCRALDTARIAFGNTEGQPALDSFFSDRSAEETRTQALRQMVAQWSGQPGVLVLVTHQVNITALTGVVPAEGEILVLRPKPAGFELVARLRP